MKVLIKKIGINGEGIGYIDRLPVFIPEALIDEEVDIRIEEKMARYAIGSVNRVVTQSKDRIQPKCYIQHACGACPLMIARYPKQLEYKHDLLRQSLIKYAQINPKYIEKVIASEEVFAYRNQFKLPCGMEDGKLVSGLYMQNTNYFIDLKKCWVHHTPLEAIRIEIMNVLNRHHLIAYDYHEKKGIRSIVVRGFEGKFQCSVITGIDALSETIIKDLMNIKGMYSLWQSVHTEKKTADAFGKKVQFLGGERYLPFTMNGFRFEISPRSFFRLNTDQAANLYRIIASMVEGNQNLIVEAYSGIGTLSLHLNDKAKEIIGIDNHKDAVLNANMNAKRNDCKHITFLCDDAASKLVYLSKTRTIDTLVVDAPRSGLDDAMLDCILRSKIKTVVYVSCNPATLGKNLTQLTARYHVKKIQPMDMFPHTPNVESVVFLKRK